MGTIHYAMLPFHFITVMPYKGHYPEDETPTRSASRGRNRGS
jgi:hypothetical protein